MRPLQAIAPAPIQASAFNYAALRVHEHWSSTLRGDWPNNRTPSRPVRATERVGSRRSGASRARAARRGVGAQTTLAWIVRCLLVTLSCLSGCGASEHLGVSATVTRFIQHVDCGLLTTGARVRFTGRADVAGCDAVFAARGRPPVGTVSEVSIRGDRATASLLDSGGLPLSVLSLVRADGQWRIDTVQLTSTRSLPGADLITQFLTKANPLLRAAAPLGYEVARVMAPAGSAGSLTTQQADRLRAIAGQTRQIALALRRLSPPPDLLGPMTELTTALDGSARSEDRLLETTSGRVSAARVTAYRNSVRADGLMERALLALIKRLSPGSATG